MSHLALLARPSLSVARLSGSLPVAAARARGLHTQAARRADSTGWSQLVRPYTNPKFVQRMKEMDGQFANMRAEVLGVSDKVAPIDWESYEKTIGNKALFQQIRKEYEALKFDESGNKDEVNKLAAEYDLKIKVQEKAASVSKQEIEKLKDRLKEAEWARANCHNLSYDQLMARVPGLEQQLAEEALEGRFIPHEEMEAIANRDPAELRADLLNPNVEIEVPVSEHLPTRVGNFDLATEQKKADELLEAMFGGSPAFAEYKAEQAKKKKAKDDAAAAKAAADAAAHHHEGGHH